MNDNDQKTNFKNIFKAGVNIFPENQNYSRQILKFSKLFQKKIPKAFLHVLIF